MPLDEALRSALRDREEAIESLATREPAGPHRKALFAYALALSDVEAFARTGIWRRVPGEPFLTAIAALREEP